MDPTLYAMLRTELSQILESLDDQLTDKDQGELRNLMHRREYGVAFEWLVACIVEDEIPLPPDVYDRIWRAGRLMGLDRDLTEILGPSPARPAGEPSQLIAEETSVRSEEPRTPPEAQEPRPESSLSELPIYQPENEDDEELEETPRTVLITGACGKIGRKLRAAWAEMYDLVLIDIAPNPGDDDVVRADLSVFDEEWVAHFHDVDTVVHLAANPNEFATWEELEGPNLDALNNVFLASAMAGVERLVFASSNHAMGGYRDLGDMPVTTALPPRPDSPYGATKLMGERLGRSLAQAFDLSFVALRLGWVQEGDNRPETLPDEWARAMWLSNRDLVRLFECAIEAELETCEFAVLNGMSNNRGMRWDLGETAELLGYCPEDDAYAEEI